MASTVQDFDLSSIVLRPSITAVVLIPVISLILHTLYTLIYNLYFHPLASYPGPLLWRISFVPWTLADIRGSLQHQLLGLHQQYGHTVRITPNDLSFTQGQVWKDVWAHRQGHAEFSKKNTLRVKPVNGTQGILGSEKADHSRFRRLLSAGFSERGMRGQQPVILSYVDKLISGLRSKAQVSEPQDMVKWYNWITFDVIGKLAFGEDFSCLDKQETHPWIEAVFGSLKGLALLSAMRTFRLDWLLPYIIPSKSLELRQRNADYSADKIAQRIKMGSEQGDFWDSVMEKSANGQEKGMTQLEMESNASNIVLGGSETTATLLSGCTYLLLTHPRVMQKITQEIRSSFKNEGDIDLFTVNGLRYTLAVLDETMRIYPPVPEQAPRHVPAGGDTVMSTYLPENTRIHISQFVSNHLASNFTRPDEFIPERFLNGEEGYAEFKNDNYDVWQPFSVGSRNCIGKNLAYAEMRLVLAKVLWNFDLELAGEKAWLDQRTFILWEKLPLMVKMTERRKA